MPTRPRPSEHTVTAKLDPDTAAKLAALSRERHVSPEQIVADAVREFVAREADPSLGTDRAVPPPKGG